MNVSTEPVLVAHGVTKTYGPTVALDGVDLLLHPGESLAIMGASGSGKTTLLHCLAAIIRPDAGSIRLRAQGVAERELTTMTDRERSMLRRSGFGFVFQEGMLLPELTAIENAALPLIVGGARRREAEVVAGGWLGALGLAGLEQRRIGQLSGGQQQRVAIARAQVTGAPVVFADEPTGALDSATSVEVMTALLDATAAQGRSLVVVTHDEGVAARCDRTIRMIDGRIEAAAGATSLPSAPAAVAGEDRR